MRRIIRKLNKQEELTSAEYGQLMEYIEVLKTASPASYYIFYEKYAVILHAYYQTFIPKYVWNMDNLINFLTSNPHLFKQKTIPLTSFPRIAHPYLRDTFGSDNISLLDLWQDILNPQAIKQLPSPRQEKVTIKYEENNPYKEKGLKTHFERLKCYDFITRIQSYRYLTANKANLDRFEVVAPDCLGGIFTNKQKSIYYYVFLTEADNVKAENAAQLLNYTFYGRSDGD